MAGETNLTKLLGSMQPLLHPQHYVFCTAPAEFIVPADIKPVMEFREREGKTLILEQDVAARLGLQAVYPCRMITLQIHSSLEAVGFLATITTRLASAGMGVNPVSAFFHDHLFIRTDQADEAVALLKSLAAENA